MMAMTTSNSINVNAPPGRVRKRVMRRTWRAPQVGSTAIKRTRGRAGASQFPATFGRHGCRSRGNLRRHARGRGGAGILACQFGRHPCRPFPWSSIPRGTGNTGQGCPANWQARMPAPPGWRGRQAACKKLRCACVAARGHLRVARTSWFTQVRARMPISIPPLMTVRDGRRWAMRDRFRDSDRQKTMANPSPVMTTASPAPEQSGLLRLSDLPTEAGRGVKPCQHELPGQLPGNRVHTALNCICCSRP